MSHFSKRLLWGLLAVIAGTTGCRSYEPPAPQQEPAPTRPSPQPAAGTEPKQAPTAEADLLETMKRLEAIGYVRSARETSSAEDGTRSNPARYQPGYTLVTHYPLRRTDLLGMDKKIVNSWEGKEGTGNWDHSLLLANGDLLVILRDESLKEGHLLRLSWDGIVLWKKKLGIHHDMYVQADGRLLTLTEQQRKLPVDDEFFQLTDNSVAIANLDGELLEERSIFDTLMKAKGVFRFIEIRTDDPWVDLIHANAVRPVHVPELADTHPIYHPGNLLITLRHQDSVIIFNWERDQVLWNWGRGQVSQPHDARMLPNGNILVFDNGVRTQQSRIVEVAPLTGKIVWEYRAPNPKDFYTASRGSAQRLDNGNTLIAESNKGYAFEITPTGEKVWDYKVSYKNPDNTRAVLTRVFRYDAAMVDAIRSNQ